MIIYFIYFLIILIFLFIMTLGAKAISRRLSAKNEKKKEKKLISILILVLQTKFYADLIFLPINCGISSSLSGVSSFLFLG